MHDHGGIPSSALALVLLAGVGCGDDTSPPVEDSSTSDPSTSTDPTVTVTATDTGSGATDTSVDSSGDDPTTGPTSPEIELSIDGQTVASGDLVELPSTVDVDAVGRVVTVTIENVGTSDLSIASATLDTGDVGHFALDDTGLASTLTAGESTSVGLTFAPTNGGRKTVTLVVANDDLDEGEYAVSLVARTTPNTFRPLTPAASPSGRFNTALAATGDGRVLLFGGRQADGVRRDDTWVYEVESGEWTELLPPAAPSARGAHAMAALGDGRVLLFGGNETNGPDETPRSDTWVFDPETEAWTELMPMDSPPARFQHALVEIGDGAVLLQGGRVDFGVELSDTWIFDRDTETWTELGPAMTPGDRAAFTMAFDGTDTVTMVGGTVGSSMLTDETWRYSLAGDEWTAGAPAGGGPRFNTAGAWLEGLLVVWSGKPSIMGEPMAGTWGYDPSGDAWVDLAPGTEPDPRFSHAMVAVGDDKAIVFGGLLVNAGPGSATDEMWEYVAP